MSHPPIPTWFFATIVVRAQDRIVLVQETGDEETWGLPGGRLEPGERFVDAALREAREEAGIGVELTGILGFEHTPLAGGRSRMGIAFAGTVAPDTPLKSEPDDESLGAAWFTRADLQRLPLRSGRIPRLVDVAFSDAPLIPLDRVLDFEAWARPQA